MKTKKKSAVKKAKANSKAKTVAGAKTPAQTRALARLKTSFGVLFQRKGPITEVEDANGDWVEAKNPGEIHFISNRRFGTPEEAEHHGKRFKRIEGHEAFFVVWSKKKPNAWVNWKTGKTNPLIGRKRTDRR